MHGLIRMRQFTLSEGHLVCMREQLEQEFFNVLDLINYIMRTLGIEGDVSYRFSKWDKDNKEKYMDTSKNPCFCYALIPQTRINMESRFLEEGVFRGVHIGDAAVWEEGLVPLDEFASRVCKDLRERTLS